MSNTIIYTCGKGMTSQRLVETTYVGVDSLFPEVYWNALRFGIARTEHEQVALVPDLIGQTIVTVSRTIIDTILSKVRLGHIKAADVELYCNGSRVAINLNGEILDDWANESLGQV